LTHKILATTAATEDSTLYVEQRGEQSPYELAANGGPSRTVRDNVIRVVEADTLDTAVELLEDGKQASVCVLNMANAFHQGGGWLEGTTAQEEQLCYRTTLAVTLKIPYYPIPDVYPMPGASDAARRRFAESGREAINQTAVIFSPRVAITRYGPPEYELFDVHKKGKKEVDDAVIISVISVAALDLRDTQMRTEVLTKYPHDEQRAIMKDKIRLLLRVSVRRGKKRLVLGALGCGVFKNPPVEVATLFREVFQEEEFRGGLWEQIVFAVKRDTTQLNFQAFEKVLNGMEIP
jgi:hypothetical protein